MDDRVIKGANFMAHASWLLQNLTACTMKEELAFTALKFNWSNSDNTCAANVGI